jgi:hypothetical protein
VLAVRTLAKLNPGQNYVIDSIRYARGRPHYHPTKTLGDLRCFGVLAILRRLRPFVMLHISTSGLLR